MAKQTTREARTDGPDAARAKAFAALMDAVDAVRAAAVALVNADAACAEDAPTPGPVRAEPKAYEAPGTRESVKAAIAAAQKRGVRTEALQKLVMGYGACVDGKPSIMAMPVGENAIRCVAAIEALQ